MQQSIQDQIHIQFHTKEITLTKGAGTDTSDLEVVVYSNQRDGDETNAGNGMHMNKVGQEGITIQVVLTIL